MLVGGAGAGKSYLAIAQSLILVFPLPGHGTCHAYRALRPADRSEDSKPERVFINLA